MTMNCSVAPAPQNSVVVASEIWPSRSFQSSALQWANSRIRWNGFRLTLILYVVSLAMQLVLGTVLGLLVHRTERLKGIVRTVMMSPALHW